MTKEYSDNFNVEKEEQISKNENFENMIMIPISKLKPHPKNDEILPPLSNAALRNLKDRIKQFGFTEAIEIVRRAVYEQGIYKHIILDGHHRYKILTEYYQELNIDEIPARFIDISENEEEDYIISKNFDRRQLSKLMQSFIRGRQYHSIKADIGTNQYTKKRELQNDTPKKTKELMADQYGLSPSTIMRDNSFYLKCKELIELTSYSFVFDLLNGEILANKSNIIKFAKMQPEEIQKIWNYYETTKKVNWKSLKDLIDKPEQPKSKKVNLSIPKNILNELREIASLENLDEETILRKFIDEWKKKHQNKDA